MGALRLGFIGTGKFSERHIGVLAALNADVEVVAHLGRKPESGDAAAARLGGAGYVDLAEFLRDGRPDAVILAVPPDAHGEYELALCEAQIPFLVEKPIGLDRGQIQRVAEAIDKAMLPVAVGFNWRASDFIPAVQDLLRAHPPRMVIGRYHGGTPGTAWWRKQARSGGQFVEQACHVVDMALHLVGDAELLAAAGSNTPLPDYPDADVSAAGAALVHFAAGQPGMFTATCIQPEIGGADVSLICDNLRVVVGQRGFSVLGPGRNESFSATGDAYEQQDRAFLDAVRTGTSSNLFCDYRDAVRTNLLCLDIRDAIAKA